jgi:transposase
VAAKTTKKAAAKPAATRVEKRPVGRPTEYRPEYCARVVELGKQGYTKAMTASELDVCRFTLDRWAAEHEEFCDAIARSRDEALSFMEKKGLAGLDMQGFNAGLYKVLMVGMFPGEYVENKKIELTGKNGGPISSENKNTNINMTAQEFEEVAARIVKEF